MKYEKINEFTKRTKKSRSSIYRFYAKNIEFHNETEMIRNKRMYPIEHAKYFDSEIMFDEYKSLCLENQSLKNLIECLVDKDSLTNKLWQLDWDFFYTIAYKAERNQKSCFRQMHSIYEELNKMYGDKTEIRLFFTTEPFKNRIGYHNHFVIYIGNKKLYPEIISMIGERFSFDRIDYKKYDKYRAGLFYIAKDGLVDENWDLLGNNLKAMN